jgi:hypothetical protein
VWECDPAGRLPAAARPALGVFSHEAAAVEPVGRQLYLTEDEGDGGFYRFTPTAYPSLLEGLLEVAVVLRSPGPDGTTDRPRTVTLARRRFRATRRERRARLRLGPKARRRLRRRRRPFTARLLVTARLPNGRRLSAVRRVQVLG